jgi:methyl-accepting chemotaxis protein
VESSGEALRQIVAEVSAVSGLVEEIAEAAEKQATGISEISGMVAAMDQFTQQNAAMVEETSAGTRNLSLETEKLVEQLTRFSLAQTRGGSSDAGRSSFVAPSSYDRAPAPAPVRRPAETPAPSAPVIRKAEYKAPAPAAPAFQGNTALRVQEDDWSEF